MPYPFYKINPSYCYKRTHVKHIKKKYNLSFKLQILRVTATFVLNQNNDLKEKKTSKRVKKNEKKFVDDCSKKYYSKEN